MKTQYAEPPNLVGWKVSPTAPKKCSVMTVIAVTLYFLYSHFFSAPVQASTILFQDDFSQGLDKWDAVRSNGSSWSVVNGQAEAYVPTRSTIVELVPKDMYWNSAWTDFEYELDYTTIEGVDKNISFAWQNTGNWYEIHFVETFYNLVRLWNGSVPFSVNNPFLMQNGKTYHIIIRFNKGRIEIWVNGQKIGDEVDHSFNNNYGKIGLKAGTGAATPTRVRYDNVVVRTIDPPEQKLAVPMLKQTDPIWKDEEYDHASLWADRPTIERWGCALTSLTMIMQYHGITTMPDGTSLTPAILNTWLKSQPDGYIGAGALNWLAATRLTHLINQQFGTPKLEYSRGNQGDGSGTATDTLFTSTIAELQQNKPVILEIAGHFLVGTGFISDLSDLLINDPAYSYTKFSQHQKPLLSTRKFQPSQTDLSYILLAHEPGLAVNLTAASGADVLVDIFSEPLQEDFAELDSLASPLPSPTTQPTLTQHSLAKPADGSYLITLSQPTLQPFTLSMYAYDVAANPTILTQTGWVGPRPITFQLSYSKTSPSLITHQNTWVQLQSDLDWLHEANQFLSHYWYFKISRLVGLATTSDAHTQNRYRSLILKLIDLAQPDLTPASYEYLQQQLAEIS